MNIKLIQHASILELELSSTSVKDAFDLGALFQDLCNEDVDSRHSFNPGAASIAIPLSKPEGKSQ